MKYVLYCVAQNNVLLYLNQTQVHYRPIYLEPYYQGLGFEKGLCPKAEAFWETELSLPMHNSLTKKDLEHVTDNIRRWIGKHST